MNTETVLANVTKDVTRLEVIDESGRAYVVHGITVVDCVLQDDRRTLKVFVNGLGVNP